MKPPSQPPPTKATTTTKLATTTTTGALANGLISMNFCLQFCTGQGRENTGNDGTV